MTYSLWRHLHPPPTVYRTILVHATDKRSFTTCSLTVVSSTNGLLQRSRSETWSLIADRSDRLTLLRFLHLTNSFSALYAIFFALSDRIWVTYDVTHHAHVHRIKTDLCVCTTGAWLQRSFASARFFRRLLLWVILEIRSRSVTSVEFTYGRRSVSINIACAQRRPSVIGHCAEPARLVWGCRGCSGAEHRRTDAATA